MNTANPTAISDAIRLLRSTLKLSQSTLAIRLGVSASTVRAWEQEINTPSAAASTRLAELAGKSLPEIRVLFIRAANQRTSKKSSSVQVTVTLTGEQYEQIVLAAARLGFVRGGKPAAGALLSKLLRDAWTEIKDGEFAHWSPRLKAQGGAA